MMTKKDFELLAQSIRTIIDKDQRLNAAVAVAAACLQSNPRFDTTTFYVACNVVD